MERKIRTKFSAVLGFAILIFMVVVLTLPKWISIFYPEPQRNLVFSVAHEYDVDPYLVFAIIRAESKYQNGAESPAGARGLMQIMPETARWIAEQQEISGFSPDSLHDPETNIRFGCWYLADLNREFGGHTPVVIAAYNAGRGKLKEWMTEGKWDGSSESIDKIPFRETRLYVKRVLKNYAAYQAIYK